MGERVVLVDGTGLLFRAWHAIPNHLKTTRGLSTNALYGFAQMFRKILAGRRPAYGAVVFDAGGRTFRRDRLETYKEARPGMPDGLRAQLAHVDRLVEAHHFPILRVPGVEADDVIATLCCRALDAGHDAYVVSGDKDLAQLVGERVRMLDTTKEVLYDADTVFRKWGVRPEQIPDLLGLVGDAVDGIPGVSGVGERSATRWLAEFGSLSEVLKAAEDGRIAGRSAKLLRDQRPMAELCRELATLRVDVDLPIALEELAIALPKPEDLDDIYLELEFWSLLSPSAAKRVEKQTPIAYYVCDTPEMATAALQAECCGPEPVAVHVLFEFPDHLRGALTGIALSPRLGTALYFPFAGPGLQRPEGLAILADWLEDPQRTKLVHEGKRATVVLRRHGVELRGVVGDSALASYLVDPTKHLPHRLEQVAREYLHVGLQPLRALIGNGRDRRAFAELTVDKAGAWACHNADAIGACWRALAPRLRDDQLDGLFAELDLPLSDVLARMETTGVRVDPAVLQRIGERLAAERAALGTEIAALAGRTFNPGSHRQLGQVLFAHLGLPVIRRTKTGYSVDAEVLDELADQHAVIPKVLRWRTVDKLIHTYTDVLLAAVEPDGRIRPTFQQTVGAAGRLITTEPDLQRTPVRTDEFRELREAFVASEGAVLMSADFSQIELRVLAHLSGDPALGDAYREGRDLHRATAAALFGVPDVSPRQREIGKTVNFATIYGQGAAALARQLGIPKVEARAHITSFFRAYAGVDRWRSRVVADAYVAGYVTTLFGRRRYIPELFSNDPNERAYGERVALNSPVQGSAADLCKRAMLGVDRALRAQGLAAQLVLQIHDELVLDVPEPEVDVVRACVREAMEGAGALSVPLVVEVGHGRTWADAH